MRYPFPFLLPASVFYFKYLPFFILNHSLGLGDNNIVSLNSFSISSLFNVILKAERNFVIGLSIILESIFLINLFTFSIRSVSDFLLSQSEYNLLSRRITKLRSFLYLSKYRRSAADPKINFKSFSHYSKKIGNLVAITKRNIVLCK